MVAATLKRSEEVCYGYIPARYPIHNEDEQGIKLGFTSQVRQVLDILTLSSSRNTLITDQCEFSVMQTGLLNFG